jgi:hypothetical protein
MFASLHGI